jgi:sacsin
LFLLQYAFSDISESSLRGDRKKEGDTSFYSMHGLTILLAALGGLAYSQEIARLVSDASSKVLLDALVVVSKKEGSSETILGWNDQMKRAFKNLLLDCILAKIDPKATLPLSDIERDVLMALPVWERHGGDTLEECPIFDHIDRKTLVHIPPRGVDERLLGEAFVVLRSDLDRPLYTLLGFTEPSKGSFFATYILPQISVGRIEGSRADALAMELLRNLTQLEEEHPGLSKTLADCLLFRSSSGVLCCPKQMYDPQVPYLQVLLPQDVFPSSALFSDPSLLLRLRSLGMNSSITAEGVLTGARYIQASIDKMTTLGSECLPKDSASHTGDPLTPSVKSVSGIEGMREESLSEVMDRALGLLQYVERNVKTLLLEADPIGLKKAQVIVKGTRNGDSDSKKRGLDGDVSDEVLEPLGGAWGSELRSLTWVPVMTSSPRGMESKLPWPSRIHVSALATPSQCVHMRDIWTCSSTHRVCSVDVKEEIVRMLLGWEHPVHGRIASLQLLTMKDALHAGTLHSVSSLTEAYYQIIPRILESLNSALVRESPREIDMWLKVLKGKAVVWINSSGRFVKASKVAFSSPLSGINTEPYLFVVQGELFKFRPLLTALGVRESFDGQDLAGLTRDMCNQFVEVPLPSQALDVCVAALKAVVKMLRGQDQVEDEEEEQLADAVDSSNNRSVSQDSQNSQESRDKTKDEKANEVCVRVM